MKMIVVFSDRIPPAVRCKMKLWFIEPSPNVFISSVSDALAQRVCDKLFESCKDDSSLIIIKSKNNPPGYEIMKKSNEIYKERLVRISGLQLVRTEASVKSKL